MSPTKKLRIGKLNITAAPSDEKNVQELLVDLFVNEIELRRRKLITMGSIKTNKEISRDKK
jgi:hypothetical protein